MDPDFPSPPHVRSVWHDLHNFLLNFIALAYATRERYNNACLLVSSLPFSTKYRVFCAISDFVQLLLFADTSCLIQRRYRKLFFFRKGHWTWRYNGIKVYPILQPTWGSGECRTLPQRPGSGVEPQPKTAFGLFYTHLLYHFSRITCFSAFWKLAARDSNKEIQENITGVGKVTLHACIFNGG